MKPKVSFDYYNGRYHVVLSTSRKEDTLKNCLFSYVALPHGNSMLYWAADPHEGYVSFFCHDPRIETGFGGSTFELRMQDGTTRTIKGPWSSNSAAMNQFFPHSMEVTLDCRYRYAACMLVEALQTLLDEIGVKLITKNGFRYEVDPDTVKPEFVNRRF